jgi:hypothetical protein
VWRSHQAQACRTGFDWLVMLLTALAPLGRALKIAAGSGNLTEVVAPLAHSGGFYSEPFIRHHSTRMRSSFETVTTSAAPRVLAGP